MTEQPMQRKDMLLVAVAMLLIQLTFGLGFMTPRIMELKTETPELAELYDLHHIAYWTFGGLMVLAAFLVAWKKGAR